MVFTVFPGVWLAGGPWQKTAQGVAVIGTVTAVMLLGGLCALVAVFAHTKVSSRGLEWRVFRRKRLSFEHVRYAAPVLCPGLSTFILQVHTIDGKKIEIPGGTKELAQAFTAIAEGLPEWRAMPT
jgi:hypothetical protein